MIGGRKPRFLQREFSPRVLLSWFDFFLRPFNRLLLSLLVHCYNTAWGDPRSITIFKTKVHIHKMLCRLKKSIALRPNFDCHLKIIAILGLALLQYGCKPNQSTDGGNAVTSTSLKNEETSKSDETVLVSFQDAKGSGAVRVELDAKRAFSYLEKICAIGSRTSGTPGMKKQQELLQEHFESHGGTVLWQAFEVRHPETGNSVEIKNMIVQWKPELRERVMLCTHYDTKPFPSNDPKNPRGLFVGANDGASGPALFMELAHVMNSIPTKVGVDFVLFDGEELVYDERRDENYFFLGSTYFSQAYAANPNSTRYRCAILLDMIADKDLQLYYEENSFKYAKALVEEVWSVAKRLKIKEFEPRIQHFIRDDHLKLNEIANIPAIDIIDFDYPKGAKSRVPSYWHTMADTPDKCSGASLTKVGRVLLEWIAQQ